MKITPRTLRKNQTPSEEKLWFNLKNRKLKNHKFRRQHLIGPYIVDFCCLNQKLIIEIDGNHHKYQHTYDNARTSFLEKKGFKVLRFWSNDVVRNLRSVLIIIEKI